MNALRSAYENKVVYDRLYRLCRQLHEAFGGLGSSTDLSGVMKKLIGICETQAVASCLTLFRAEIHPPHEKP